MASPPLNIVQITTHDTGRHFGCYGYDTLHTPAIDAIAADGVRLDNCFCAVPICSPSRTSMLTGLYPQQHGQMDLVNFGWQLRDPALHLARRLKSAGYRTALFGVQHEVLGSEKSKLQFDHVANFSARDSAAAVGDRVADYLKRSTSRDQPFYLQVGFRETHTPFVLNGAEPDTERGLFVPPYLADDEGNRQRMAAFQGAVRMADQGVARIAAALRDAGLEENTLLVVTTDHGIEVPRAKWTLYDPGIEIGMVMRCPALGLTGGRVFDGLVSNVDYLPTVCEWLGLSSEGAAGRSFADELTDGGGGGREAVFAMFGKRSHPRCVRTKRHKLIRHFDAAAAHKPPVSFGTELALSVVAPVELYNLEADPVETNNLADHPEYQGVRAELEAQLWAWMESVGDPLLAGPVASPSYELAMREYVQWKQQPV